MAIRSLLGGTPRSGAPALLVPLLLLLLLLERRWLVCAEAKAGGESRAAELYEEARRLSSARVGPPSSDLQELLTQAADVTIDSASATFSVGDAAHPGALYDLSLFYKQGWRRNWRLADGLLAEAAQRGWPDAQAEVGFRLLIGMHNSSSPLGVMELGKDDAPRGLLHLYFAALSNSTAAATVLGYRHSVGLGVPKSCAAAVLYYNPVAEAVVAQAREGGFPAVDKLRLSLKTASGMHRGREQDMLQYYQYSADLGNVAAQTAVGQLYNHGTQGLERDHSQALHYFSRAAEQDDPKAMSQLGHMYANGQGVEQNMDMAVKWFTMGAARNHPSAQYGLGYLHLTGNGVAVDYDTAFNYFTLAAEQNHPDAQFHLGMMHLRGWGVKQDRQRAFHFFNLAAVANHALAQYNAAMVQLGSDPSTASCEKALTLLKRVAERGPVAEALQAARDSFVAGHQADALLHYLRAAEMGSELGLSNAAFMLRHRMGTAAKGADWLAVQLYSRASDQMNIHALLAVADAYYYGRGVKLDWRHAARLYEKASERSAQALFNLGYMHQYGAGLEQDLHLAKRYYDLARSQDKEATVPVSMALAVLRVQGWWDAYRGLLPAQLSAFVQDTLFSVPQPASSLPEHNMPSLGWLDALFDYLDWDPAQQPPPQQEQSQMAQGVDSSRSEAEGDGLTDSYDTALLLFLCIGLAVVLRRRNALRRQIEAGQQDVDPVGGVAAQPFVERAWQPPQPRPPAQQPPAAEQ